MSEQRREGLSPRLLQSPSAGRFRLCIAPNTRPSSAALSESSDATNFFSRSRRTRDSCGQSTPALTAHRQPQ